MDLAGVLLLLAGCYTTLAAICPTDWQRYGESCYLLITQRMNWTDANETCFKSNATLALPNSEQDQTFIWNAYIGLYNGVPPHGLWIGYNDIHEEGNWHPCPLRGESNAYENWGAGYPRNDPDKNCAVISTRIHGLWKDRSCHANKKHAACERPLDTTAPVFCLQTGPDGRIKSQCMVGHVIKELRADGVVSCGKACRSEPRCRSFNLLMKQGPGKMVCQRNNATRHEATDLDMMEKEICYFFDL